MGESLQERRMVQVTHWSRAFVAVHEAGHAVTAAYLSIPFHDVTARRNKPGGLNGSFSFLVDSDSAALANHCVVVMGSRAAVDWWMGGPGITLFELAELTGKTKDDLERWMERNYCLDEQALQSLGNSLYGLNPSSNHFVTWRDEVLKRVENIVAIPHVQEAIIETAAQLMID
jgi:hypothetical protein